MLYKGTIYITIPTDNPKRNENVVGFKLSFT